MYLKQEMDQLNPQQRTAVQHVNGRLLILAGAGSGKTKVLTLRMAYLIEELGVSPQTILGLTFTNKAAAEMRHRLRGFVSESICSQVTLCTFHSFCMQVLRRDIDRLGYTKQFTLYDEQDVQRLIKAIARDILQHEGSLPSLEPTLALIRRANHQGLTPNEIAGAVSTWHDEFAQTVYIRLQAAMRAHNALDFDNLLGLTAELLEQCPDLLHYYQERFRYVMIDEYQDTNPIQYRLASLLTAKYSNLCVVGDDDQSIYGWRGAQIKNILCFDNAVKIKLEQNYRSTNTILKAANAVIKNNQQRHLKVLWSERGEGEPIGVIVSPNESEEAAAVVAHLVHLKERLKLRWNDIAILYRSNALSRQFELALMKHAWRQGDQWLQGIPYEIFGGLEFYERREVKDLCAYLRVLVNPSDEEALLRIVNQPRRGIGEEALDKLTTYNRQHHIPLLEVLMRRAAGDALFEHLDISNKALSGMQDFIAILEESKSRFVKGKLAEALQWLIPRIDYQRAIKEEVKSDQMRLFKEENIQEFVNALADFDQQENQQDSTRGSLADFVSQITLNQHRQQMSQKRIQNDRVHLMTFHSAKGLEFPVCFLIGLEDHIIPHEKSLKETGLEEERRLMYVGMTRAQQNLVLSMAKQRKRMGKDEGSRPSRFLHEIPKELLQPVHPRV